MKRNKNLVLSVLLSFTSIVVLVILGSNVSAVNKIYKKAIATESKVEYKQTIDVYNDSEEQNDKTILFLGDSHTEGNNWNEVFSNPNIINKGIRGDTIDGLEERVKDYEKFNPDVIFLMIGVNDLVSHQDMTKFLKNYDKLLSTIIFLFPKVKIYVQSIMPINIQLYAEHYKNSNLNNSIIETANTYIFELCKKNKIELIDIYSLFSKNGELSKNYTLDGLHLNDDGYKVWVNKISPIIIRTSQ